MLGWWVGLRGVLLVVLMKEFDSYRRIQSALRLFTRDFVDYCSTHVRLDCSIILLSIGCSSLPCWACARTQTRLSLGFYHWRASLFLAGGIELIALNELVSICADATSKTHSMNRSPGYGL